MEKFHALFGTVEAAVLSGNSPRAKAAGTAPLQKEKAKMAASRFQPPPSSSL